jgi:diguanylate cyclase (GGDEF)-like protein
MSSDAVRDPAPARRRRIPYGLADWVVWSLPTRVRLPVFLVESTALLLLLALLPKTVIGAADLVAAGTLIGAAIVHTEIAVQVERIRRRVTESVHVDLTSVWTFAGAVLLPPVLAAVVAIIVSSHVWWRSWRPRVPLFKQAFNSATVVLACLAASVVLAAVGDQVPGFAGPSDLLSAGVALLVYTSVNSCLVAGVITMSVEQPDLAKAFGHWDDNALEIATLSLGALTAMAFSISPALILFVLPPLLVLHRAVLVRHLEEAANTDSKTGLLNAAAWHSRAERELRRVRRADGPRGVLVLDLDHFKGINDAYGHVAGDQVLAAVAQTLRDETRERDLVGRFGGEEFVVLLAGGDRAVCGGIEAVAERIRRRIEALQVSVGTPDGPLTVDGLTVSVGGAVSPPAGSDLQALLQVADAALYAAKRAGRNKVRMGVDLPVQVHPMVAAEPVRTVEPPAAAR